MLLITAYILGHANTLIPLVTEIHVHVESLVLVTIFFIINGGRSEG